MQIQLEPSRRMPGPLFFVWLASHDFPTLEIAGSANGRGCQYRPSTLPGPQFFVTTRFLCTVSAT